MPQQIYTIGSFRLEPHRQLLQGDRLVHIGGKALDILSVLAKADGRVVTKDELMEAVWTGVVVEENAIQVHVSSARRALGAEATKLGTVWGRGYRLDASRCDLACPQVSLSDETVPADPEAVRLVTQAQAFAGRVMPDGLLRSIDLLERAIARDPSLRSAWTGLAGSLMVAVITGVLPPDRRISARAMAEQAIRIDERSGAPCAIRAVLDMGECRWLDAEAGLRLAAERSPDNPLVQEAALLFRVSIGHIDTAAQLAEGAVRAAPALPNIALSRAHVAMVSGDLATVDAQLEIATLLGSAEDRAVMRVLRAELALAAGDSETAMIHVAALFAGVRSLPVLPDGAAAAISAALVGGGDPDAASATIMRLIETMAVGDALERTQILFGQLINWQVRLGALDAAFALAERLIDERAQSGFVAVRAMHVWWRTDMRAFRDDSRFARLTTALDLPTAWNRLGWPESYSAARCSAGAGRTISVQDPRRAR